MYQHEYKTIVEWTGNTGKGTLNYKAYSRDHQIFAPNKYTSINATADPHYLGSNEKYNPEELFLSSISSCHMLWYLHLCAVNHVNVVSYKDYATGVMTVVEKGSGKFTEVVLHPDIKVQKLDMVQKAIALHGEANKMCFIANSCNFEIDHRPTVEVI